MTESQLELLLTTNLQYTLIASLICVVLVRYVQYHWKRRRLYQMAKQRKGPPTFPFIGNALYFSGSATDIYNNFERLTKEFESPVPVWFGQQLYFAIWKPNDMENILNSPYALQKSDFYKLAEIFSGNTGLFTSSVPTWKKHRKIIMPTFKREILDEYVEVFSEQSEILVKQLEMEVGKGIFDISEYLNKCSLDMVCETAMGIPINAQTTDSEFMHWVHRVCQIVITRMYNIFYRFDFTFNRTALARELNEAMGKINGFALDIITKKKTIIRRNKLNKQSNIAFQKEEYERKHFLQLLVDISEDGENLTDQELIDEVNNILIGGSESTAAVDGYILILFGLYPDIQHKVYQEVMDVIGRDKRVQCTDLDKLTYLEMVIKETLRLFAIGQLVSRTVTKDIKLDSCIVPEGSSVMMFLGATHRDPDIWPNPLEFDPDRFLPEEVAKRHPYSWVPFIGGLRKCIGPKYAIMAVKVVIAEVIRKYRINTDFKNVEDIKLKIELSLKPVDSYRVSLELRK